MLEVPLVVEGDEIVVRGTWSTIQRFAADRLGCDIEDLVFRQKRNGELKQIHASSSEGWKHFVNKGLSIHASSRGAVGELGRKRKSTSHDQRRRPTPDTDLSSSVDTPPRPSAPKKSRSSDGSKGYLNREIGSKERSRSEASGSSSKITTSGNGARTHWTTKEDAMLWKSFEKFTEAMPPPNPIYSAYQKSILFSNISKQTFAGKRSTAAIISRLHSRISKAARKQERLSPRYKAIFPNIFTRLSTKSAKGSAHLISDDSSEEDKQIVDESDEDSSSESSGSEFTPPPPSKDASRSARKEPPSISDYNPFEDATAALAHRAPLSWSREGRAPAQANTSLQPMQRAYRPVALPPILNSITNPASGSSLGIGQDASSERRMENDRSSVTLQGSDPVDATAGSAKSRPVLPSAMQSVPPLSSTRATPAASAVPATTSSILLPTSQVGSLSLGQATPQTTGHGQATPQTTGQETGHGTDHAIVVKDESEDELIDEDAAASSSTQARNIAAVTCGRAGSVKKEHAEEREALRGFINPLFPIKHILTLPTTDWAVPVASWIKGNALQRVSDSTLRLNILVNCLDEFFYFSYRNINDAFSVQRTSVGITLLFLDLYHAYGDVEELQAALVELFYSRIFSSEASVPEGAQDWMTYDVCAAVSLLIPCRPSWLLTLILERCNNCRIEEVPPPANKVTLIFSRLQVLLQKLSACRGFFEREHEIKLLNKSIHRPYVDSTTLSNLQAFTRQARLSLPDKASVEATLAEIDRINREASSLEVQRKAEEDAFFTDRLLLVVSPHPITVRAVEDLITNFTLSTQIRNGPMRKKFDSTRETWNLWILQFSSQVRRQEAISKLRDHPPNQDVQILENHERTHSMCPSVGQEEQRRWLRLRCDLHLHREYHRRCVKRVKQEPQSAAPL